LKPAHYIIPVARTVWQQNPRFISFIHSGYFYSASSSRHTQRRSRLQHWYCVWN